MSPCTLNAVIAEIDPDAAVRTGTVPYVYRDDLDDLRDAHRETHFFRRDRDTIQSVTVVPGHAPIGEVRERRVRELGSLMPPLVLDALLRYFVGRARPILRHRPLTVVTARSDDRLLARALPAGVRLPEWLEQRVSYQFDARAVYPKGRPPAVLLACDVRTCISIDASVATLTEAGIPLAGYYVLATSLEAGDPRLNPKWGAVGRVVRVAGGQVFLDDHGDGPSVRAAAELRIEPRREHLAHCLRHLVPDQVEGTLARLEALVAEVGMGPERLRRIRAMFEHLGTVPLEVTPGVAVRLGALVKHGGDGPWSPPQGLLARPQLLFDPSGRRTDDYNERGLNKFGPYDRATFASKTPRIAVICQSRARAEVERFVARLFDGMPEVGTPPRQPYGRGLRERFGLQSTGVRYFEAADASTGAYRAACRAAIEAGAEAGAEWQLAVVQIDDASHLLAGAEDPYLVTKSVFMKHQVPVQEVTLEKMRAAPHEVVHILTNISLAVYAKLGGVPWVLPTARSAAHEVILGLGSYQTSVSRLGATERVVGVTTAFSRDGGYLLESRTAAVPYDDYASALLAALRRTVEAVRHQQNWQPDDVVRLVVHAFKPFKDTEVDAVEQLMRQLGLPRSAFAFLHLAENHPFLLLDERAAGASFKGATRGALVPARGTVVPLADGEWLLALTGPRELKQASDGLPRPVLVKLHRKSTFRDMKVLTRQVFAFACHSWRGFGMSSQPITIQYSDQIARVLKKLDAVPGWDAEAMVGRVGRTRWFL